jgi:hypothetical protein
LRLEEIYNELALYEIDETVDVLVLPLEAGAGSMTDEKLLEMTRLW